MLWPSLQRLVDEHFPTLFSSARITSVSPALAEPYRGLLQEFKPLTTPRPVTEPVKHDIYHHIVTTNGPPIVSRVRRLAPLHLRESRAEFERLLKAGYIRRSSSQCSSPIHVIPKENGQWRCVGDFRALNALYCA